MEVSGGKSDSAVFVGFGPLPQADYVVAVLLEEAGFGGSAAAPVARRVLETLALERLEEAVPALERADLTSVQASSPSQARCPVSPGVDRI